MLASVSIATPAVSHGRGKTALRSVLVRRRRRIVSPVVAFSRMRMAVGRRRAARGRRKASRVPVAVSVYGLAASGAASLRVRTALRCPSPTQGSGLSSFGLPSDGLAPLVGVLVFTGIACRAVISGSDVATVCRPSSSRPHFLVSVTFGHSIA